MNGNTGRWRTYALAGALAAHGAIQPAWAGLAPPFAQLLRQSQDSPRMVVLDAEVDRAQGLAEQAHARPNPTISAYTENVAGSAPYTGFDRAETTLQIDQPIEIGGKRAARIRAGEAGVVAARARGVDGRINYANDLARSYAAAEAADRRVALAEDEVEESTAVLKVAKAQVAAGKEARLRSLQAETELDAMQAELETAKAGRLAALARLSALAGVEVPFTGLSESLLDRPAASPLSRRVDPLGSSAYLAAEAERVAAEKRVVAERKQAVPDVTVQFGVRRLEVDRANAILAGVSVPLNIFDRNKGNIAAARAEARAAEARAAAARYDAQAGLGAAAAMMTAAAARRDAAERTMATANETYRLARIAYEAGKSPLSELLVARHGLGAARGVVLDAAVAGFDARATIARLQGLTITGEPLQ
jgi:cobalt-zinc-cadmium efflux system outer membrane protein